MKPIKILMFKPRTTQIFVGGTQFNLTFYWVFLVLQTSLKLPTKNGEKNLSPITYHARRSTW
jgi:hypothetical protein